jgi:hypothetical protein
VRTGAADLIAIGTPFAARVNEDPFVREDVVEPEILEVTPSQTQERFAFLLS